MIQLENFYIYLNTLNQENLFK